MKNIIVTGSSSGFGLLTTKKLATLGHTVYATMRNIETSNKVAAEALKIWAEESNTTIRVIELDVTSDNSVQKAIGEIARDSNGQIDVLINNAGLFVMGLSETVTSNQLEQIFQVNVIGAERMIKAVLPHMRRQKEGLLITISSVLSRLHLPYLGAYSATKAAIDVLGEIYHYELSKLGIDSIVLQPGFHPTDLMSKQMVPANTGTNQFYGEHGINIKNNVERLFEASPESPDAQDVADLIAQIIDTPQGQRNVWSAIGAGNVQTAVDAINASTGDLSKGVQGYLGIHEGELSPG